MYLHSGCHEEDGGIACDVIRGLYGQNVSGDGHRKQHHDERASPFEPVSEESHDHCLDNSLVLAAACRVTLTRKYYCRDIRENCMQLSLTARVPKTSDDSGQEKRIRVEADNESKV